MASVLVVIPCLNEAQSIERLVTQLIRNNPALSMRIVIVDGGSSDDSVDIAIRLALRYPQVSCLHNAKRWQSAAVNLAIAQYDSDCRYFIRLDAHAEYPDDYCKQLLAEAEVRHPASVVVAMNSRGKTWFQRAAAAAQNSRIGNGGSPHRRATGNGKWIDHGHHALMRTDIFRAVGGYDETFSHNEDAELDLRLIKAGYSIWLTPKTHIVYHPRSSPLALFKQYYNYGRGRCRTFLRHREKLKLRQMLPLAVLPAAILALLAPIHWLLTAPFMLWALLCLTYGAILGIWKLDIAAMASGLAAMIMQLGWSLGFWRGLYHNE